VDTGSDADPETDAMTDEDAPVGFEKPSCNREWTDLQLGTELDDQLRGMAIDEESNIYLAGFEGGITGVTNIEPAGDARGVILKLDPTGTPQWQAVLDTEAADTIEHLVVEPASGRIYAVGRTSGAFEQFANRGQFDGFLAEVDAEGRPGAIVQWGDERPQHPVRLSLGLGDDIAVAGFDDVYIPSNYVEALEDGFVAGFDRHEAVAASFSQRFLQKVSLGEGSRITDVVIDRDDSRGDNGSMYVTSYIGGPRDSAGIYVQKLSRDGALLWSTRISSLWVDMVTAVGLSPSGELFVTGATFLQLGKQRFGQQDAFLLKVDTRSGRLLWSAQAGSPESDYPTALAFDDAGNVYLAGETLGSVVPGALNQGSVDVFAMKLDATGALVSSWQKGSAAYDSATSMVVDHCGRVLVGGYSRGALVDGRPGPSGDDMFVLRAAL
jgi:outer membrane protein assembly factor BamB